MAEWNAVNRPEPQGQAPSVRPDIMAEWEAAQQPAAPTKPPVDVPQSRTFYEGMGDRASQLIQGPLLGWGDEAQAFLAANVVPDVMLPEHLQGKSYEELQPIYEARNRRFEEEHPYQSFALQLGGGIVPGVMAAKTFGLGSQGVSLANQMVRGMAAGAASGAIGGAGYAKPGERDVGAIVGAGLGAGFGVAAPALGAGAGWVASRPGVRRFGQKALERGGKFLKELGEDGRINIPEMPRENDLNKVEQMIAWALRDVPEEKLDAAEIQITKALKENRPMWLGESVDDASSYQKIKGILNSEGGQGVSEDAIMARAGSAMHRATSALDDLGGERSAYKGARQGLNAVDHKLDNLIRLRKAQADPLYNAVREETPIFTGERIDKAINRPRTQAAIKKVRQEFPEWETLPDNHFNVLQKAKEFMDDQVRAASREGNKTLANVAATTKNELLDAMDEINPIYKEARDVYGGYSYELESLTGPGMPLEFLADVKAGRPTEQAARKLMNMPPEAIAEARDALGTENAAEFRALVRAHLQDLVDSTKEGYNPVTKIFDTPKKLEQLKAAIGDDKAFEKLVEGLKQEELLFKGKTKYFTGSSTQTNQRTQKELDRAIGRTEAVGALRSPWQTVHNIWNSIFETPGKPELEREIAQALLDTQKGADILKRVRPTLDAERMWRGGVDAATKPVRGASGAAGTITGDRGR